MGNLFFDLPKRDNAPHKPNFWLKVALLLTIGYVVFGLILIGIPSISRVAVGVALVALLWTAFGLVTRQAAFPRILFFPLAFYAYLLFSGLYLDIYPIEYMGQLTTIWVGAIVLAVFVANGVSINLIIAGFVVLFLANMGAIAVGYDGHQLNVVEESLDSLQFKEVERKTGLAGQANLLVSLIFTLPFLLFLANKKVGVAIYLLVMAGAVATTVLSGSRAPIALTLLFTLTGAIWLIGSSLLRMLAILASIVCGIAVITFFNSPDALSKIEYSQLGELVVVKRALSTLDDQDGSTDERRAFVSQSWQFYAEKPLLGHGPNSFTEVSGAGTYAHNNYAEIAVNWGLVGLLLYYLMYIASFVGIVINLNYKLPMIATLLYLVMADHWFVTFLDRAMVLCLCLLLVKVFATSTSRRRRRRRIAR